jgi:hypothetical protein
MPETYKVLAHGAGKLAEAARVIEAVRAKLDDQDGMVAGFVKELRATAATMAKHAKELRPSAALKKWSEGNAEAMKNYHPRPHQHAKP